MGLVDIVKKGIASLGVAVALTLATPEPAEAQGYPEGMIGYVDPSTRFAAMGVNILGQGLICGVASAVEGRTAQRVFNDAAQCMLGGTIQSIGMEIGMYDVPALPGFAMRIVETGTSIIDNTLAGREMLERLHYELGPLLLEIDTLRGEIDLFWRIYPVVGLIYNTAEGHDFNILQTLSTQTFTFTRPLTESSGPTRNGMTTGNIIWLDEGSGPYLRGHEQTHVYQYIRFRPFQQTIPDELSFIEETLHLRLGEDALFLLINLPQTICFETEGDYCGRQFYDLGELEAYSMVTAAPR